MMAWEFNVQKDPAGHGRRVHTTRMFLCYLEARSARVSTDLASSQFVRAIRMETGHMMTTSSLLTVLSSTHLVVCPVFS